MNNDELESIYKTFYTPLFLFALSLSNNKEIAEDLVANAFVKALISYEKGNIKAWLYTVLKNEYYNYYKKDKHRYNNYDMTKVKSNFDVLETIIKNEQKQWLYKQIYQLNKNERNVLLLSLQRDLKDEEIAEILNLRCDYVRVIKSRAKQKLIQIAKKEGLL